VVRGTGGLLGLAARDITAQADALQRTDFNHALNRGLSELQRLYIEAGTIGSDWWERALRLLLDLTQSEYGFIGTVHEDPSGRYLRTHALSNIAWDDETRRLYEESRGKGMLFRNLDTLFGRVIVEGKTLVSNDVEHDPRAHGRPPGHPPLRHFLGLACGQGQQMRGMIGLANRPSGYSPELIADLETAGLVLGAVMHQSESDVERRRLESRLAAIVESTLDVILTIDERGTILSANAALRTVFGYDPAECIGQNVSMLMNPHDRARHNGYLERYLMTGEKHIMGKRRELLGLRKDGAEVWVELTVWENRSEAGRHFAGILRDITERVLTERRLREAAAELSSALELAKAGRWELDLLADRFSFNDAFYRIFGVTADQVGGYHLSPFEYATRFVHPEEVAIVKDEVARALASTLPTYAREIEHRFLYADGRVGYLAVRILGSREPSGALTKLFGVVQDVTARREQESERLAMREQSRVAQALSERVAELDRARSASALLTECVNFLQRSVSVDEGLELAARYVDRMYPQANVAVYSLLPDIEELFLHTEMKRFGEHAAPRSLAPTDCWALRTRGFYSMYPGGPHIRCRHCAPVPDGVLVCAPISGADRTVGLICLTFPPEEFGRESEESTGRLLRDLSRFETMAQSISGAMSTIILRESLQRLALVDELTGLPNRRAFLGSAARAAARARRTRETIIVAIYDVDHFKSINDTLGHDEGDRVLRRLSELAQSGIRADDLIGRLGGEEFGLLFVGAEAGVRQRLEELRARIAQATILRDRPVTVSIGYSVSTLDVTMSIEDLLKAADVALYSAKRGGRNCIWPTSNAP
jgi:diguanylate cyclase (GGDEF)-like protein/PAS domain S-box-containing protein